jgi:hypothetical protein
MKCPSAIGQREEHQRDRRATSEQRGHLPRRLRDVVAKRPQHPRDAFIGHRRNVSIVRHLGPLMGRVETYARQPTRTALVPIAALDAHARQLELRHDAGRELDPRVVQLAVAHWCSGCPP